MVTQNIDGLHQLAGSRRVLEVHGTARRAKCLDCGGDWPIEPHLERYHQLGHAPPCPECQGG